MFKKSIFTWTTQIIQSCNDTDRTDIVVLPEWFKISFALGGSFCLSIFMTKVDQVLMTLTFRASTWCNSFCNLISIFSKELSYNLVRSTIGLDTMFVSKVTNDHFAMSREQIYSSCKRSFCNSILKSVTSEQVLLCWFWAIEHRVNFI